MKNTHRAAFLLSIFLVCMAQADEGEQKVDFLSFAQGALPVAFEGPVAALGVGTEQALLAIDGNEAGFGLTPKPGAADTRIAFIYELPALTTFTEFAVPNVLETPSPSQTFIQQLEVAGSDSGPEGPFRVLGNTALTTHAGKGMTTTFTSQDETPVRWVRVSVQGGIDVRGEKTFFEFSEIKGFGSQDSVPMAETFSGKWKGRGVLLELKQVDARVTGCYDREGDLSGTVSGRLLRATGRSRNADIPSVFVLAVGEHGEITGVRSTNGAPFRLYSGDAAPGLSTECSEQEVPPLGCGSIIHGINFDYDSALIRPESETLLDALFAGLQAATAESVTILGHTSSEGSDAYNQKLSQQRAESVLAAMTARGVESSRLVAAGLGETQPIADNATEAGRSLNRRVEIACHEESQ